MEMTPQTEAVLKEQNKKMKHFGVEICATYIGAVVYGSTDVHGSTGLLEEKINELVKFWESQPLTEDLCVLEGTVFCVKHMQIFKFLSKCSKNSYQCTLVSF